MPTKVIETDTLGVLCHLLSGVALFDDHVTPRKSYYTAKGCESILEYNGASYRVTVEPLL